VVEAKLHLPQQPGESGA